MSTCSWHRHSLIHVHSFSLNYSVLLHISYSTFWSIMNLCEQEGNGRGWDSRKGSVVIECYSFYCLNSSNSGWDLVNNMCSSSLRKSVMGLYFPFLLIYYIILRTLNECTFSGRKVKRNVLGTDRRSLLWHVTWAIRIQEGCIM